MRKTNFTAGMGLLFSDGQSSITTIQYRCQVHTVLSPTTRVNICLVCAGAESSPFRNRPPDDAVQSVHAFASTWLTVSCSKHSLLRDGHFCLLYVLAPLIILTSC